MEPNEFNSEIEKEIQYFVDLSQEAGIKPYSRAEAIQMIEMDQNISAASARILRRYLIEIGVYKAVTEADLRRVLTSRGKAYDFRLDGVKYAFVSWDKLLVHKDLK